MLLANLSAIFIDLQPLKSIKISGKAISIISNGVAKILLTFVDIVDGLIEAKIF
jgi:hypothetical protein